MSDHEVVYNIIESVKGGWRSSYGAAEEIVSFFRQRLNDECNKAQIEGYNEGYSEGERHGYNTAMSNMGKEEFIQ